jgi:hypothetical protein
MRQLWHTAIHITLLGLGLVSFVLSTPAHACAVCAGSEDNGYFWGVLFLMSMPFAVGSLVGGWLLYHFPRAKAGPSSAALPQAVEPQAPWPDSTSSASERHHDAP